MDNEAPGVVDDGGGRYRAASPWGDLFPDDALDIDSALRVFADEQRRRRSSDI